MSAYPPGQPYHPGQPYPYGAQPYPAAPPPRRGGGKVALIVIGAVLAVCCLGGAAVGGYLYLNRSDRGYDSPRAAARATLDALVARDIETAYRTFCPRQRRKVDFAEFKRQAAEEKPIASYQLGSQHITATGSRETAIVNVTLSYADGKSVQRELQTLKENGGWWSCGDVD